MSLLFVHSPLVGPSSWTATAERMRDMGLAIAVPDLTAVARAHPPRWKTFVDTAVASANELPGDIVIVGHSGAGAYLPAIADQLGPREATLLFADAVIPPVSGAHRTPERVKGLLDAQTVDGCLRPWLEWWSEDVVLSMLPDADDRASLLADMPTLPRSFFDESVPVPDGWTSRRCAYLRLSEAYDTELARARREGWPHIELDADHLAIRTRPAQVAEVIETLLRS